ncbi:NAD(P)H-dependent oxidoreductase [Nocardioides convexus]|uniref:NAD(P)H-dependent oxidoreductase n=1 Tax=Nocardioides convexus TaxID=2712224 RepID=UPI00241859B2|nr:NAD(P)H-dependent oxidoreductase [Nocardioides convexus]
MVDHPVAFGVSTDEGDGDGWPALRQKMLDAEILVIATPIWMGQPTAVCKMVLERLDAEPGRDRRRGPDAHLGQGRCGRGRRQRGRRAPRQR